MVQWHQVNEKAEQTQLRVLVQTFYKSASSLRQLWELSDKPLHSEKEGIQYTFTKLGWPIIKLDNHIDCEKTWQLLSSRANSIAYADIVIEKVTRSGQYNSCHYQITDGKWLELFYENETIRVNGFLTG
ncbi:hypothetical protein MD588_16575 [Photobacterium sp. SDRW27]|uniref:hypothetical protein n=1 Tax=Photobacterium obscurum TaxID=2829490 RepID=UPI0022444552|nr:hypothetical protein [Photobacterium obscurum]MCW8330423.1 hypothetical protein [Photobacterium obscurum]